MVVNIRRQNHPQTAKYQPGKSVTVSVSLSRTLKAVSPSFFRAASYKYRWITAASKSLTGLWSDSAWTTTNCIGI